MTKLAVIAIGGNSLIKDEAHKSVPDQFNAVRETAMHIAGMIAQGWNAVVTHGDGRQVFEGTAGTVGGRAAPDIHTLGEGEVFFDAWDRPREKITPLAPPATLYAEFVGLCRGASAAELLPDEGFRSTRVTLYAREAARTHQRLDLRGRL